MLAATGSAVLLLPGKAKWLHQESVRRFQLKTSLCLTNISKQNNGQLFQRNQTFQSLNNGGFGVQSTYRNRKLKNMQMVCCSLEQGSGLPPFPFNLLHPRTDWHLWALGTAIPLILSFTTGKWGPLLELKNDADKVLETAEHISDVVEQVAEKVEKVADEVGDQLPDGGKLRASLELVEDLAQEAAKDAHLAGDLIDKVQEMEDKLESFMESVEEYKAEKEPKVAEED
ncbi:Detected protein of unknown function [Hibiscus syriacus]|uniref:Uncharacterized protein n=1 Tax=Hibiscus syriacus TaxID=106335 RepID=A0A6A3CB52_HIBSY|nr:uncharacterized protein LOC120201751 [Hibiscus syriacus]KAE8725976.1 Detected protein of unknown function [Hibiscus syriacus]